MKRLYLLRHAKSSWDDAAQDDFDRPLDDRGERAAAAMAVYCRQIGLAPDLLICSPAARTRATWDRLKAGGIKAGAFELPKEAYGASLKTLTALVAAAPQAVEQLLLIGHNPGMEDFALWLAAGDDPLRAELARKFPTGALAVIDLADAPWSDLSEGTGRIDAFMTPKQLV